MTRPDHDETPQREASPVVPVPPGAAMPPAVGRASVGPVAAVARPADPTPHPHAAPPVPPPPPLPTQHAAAGAGGAVIGREPAPATAAIPQQAAPAPATSPVPEQPAPAVATPATGAWSTTVARPAAEAGAAAAPATATATAARAAAAAVPDAHQGPGNGDHSGRSTNGGAGHRAVSGRMARLRIGSHTVSRSALAAMRISARGTGLILGADRQQRPVSVRFFRPEPTRTALVGGTWAGQLVAFRALALGARIAVVTSDPQAWAGFGERATGRADRVAVLVADRPLVLAATPQEPVLVIYDLGLVGSTTQQPLGPWQTQLTILRQLGQSAVPAIQECNLVMLQRLGGSEAAVAGSALRLAAPTAQFLQVMADDMLALVGDGADRYMWFAQTEVERQLAGAPRR